MITEQQTQGDWLRHELFNDGKIDLVFNMNCWNEPSKLRGIRPELD